jgi:hypothetical protein
MGEGRTPRPEPSAGDLLRACPMLCRRPNGRPSAVCRPVQSRAPGSGLVSGYATLTGAASPLDDASTAHGEEAASTLTLPPKRRGREQAGGCQLLRFAAGLTRPDGTSARILRGSGPVDTTHPHRPGPRPDHPIVARDRSPANGLDPRPGLSDPGARLRARARGHAWRRARRSSGACRGAACPWRGRARAWPGRARR